MRLNPIPGSGRSKRRLWRPSVAPEKPEKPESPRSGNVPAVAESSPVWLPMVGYQTPAAPERPRGPEKVSEVATETLESSPDW